MDLIGHLATEIVLSQEIGVRDSLFGFFVETVLSEQFGNAVRLVLELIAHKWIPLCCNPGFGVLSNENTASNQPRFPIPAIFMRAFMQVLSLFWAAKLMRYLA